MRERERHSLILRLLSQDGYASLHDICEVSGASEATVRRDLDKLEKQSQLKRVHGGAESLEPPKNSRPRIVEHSFDRRKSLMSETKRLIATKAASLCVENDTIILDGGSTTWHMTEFLRNKNLQVITNSLPIAWELSQEGEASVIITGGMVYPESRLVLNPFSPDVLENYAASKLFMSVGGIDDKGLTNHDLNVINLEKHFIDKVDEVCVLADSSKFGRRRSLYLCGLERVNTVITDRGISPEHIQFLEKAGIKVIIV